MAGKLKVRGEGLEILAKLEDIASENLEVIRSISTDGLLVKAYDEDGHVICSLKVHEHDDVSDADRFLIRSEAYRRGWDLR